MDSKENILLNSHGWRWSTLTAKARSLQTSRHVTFDLVLGVFAGVEKKGLGLYASVHTNTALSRLRVGVYIG